MSTPVVPPRPTRANGTTTAIDGSTPQVPARPSRKANPSPAQESRSPLNELPNPVGNLAKKVSRSNLSPADVPPRPPSVSFPSVGQEGTEYASFDLLPQEATTAGTTDAVTSSELATPEQTRNIAQDMPLHAPKASVPQSTAKSRIKAVTGTDSTQAAAAGIGQANPEEDVHKTPADSTTSLVEGADDVVRRVASTDPASGKPKSTTSRPGSRAAHSSRPGSVYEDNYEHGIPQIGQHIPLYKNAGDVQAPGLGIAQSAHSPGIGFFNDGSARAHHRKKSGKHEFGPPGSYGLHSHGYEPHDQFEREWYAKHPDRAAAEGYNAYGRSRPESALSIAQLNRIVTQTDDTGAGSDPTTLSGPGEDIGYSASDAYAARVSPRPSPVPTRDRKKRPSSGSQPPVESPLRRTSFPFNNLDHAVEDDVIHVGAPEYRTSRVTGGGPADGAVDLGPEAGNTAEEGGWFMERGSGTPILASDEVRKRRESAFMQAAVNPEYHYDDYDSEHLYESNSRRSSIRVPSRPSSRHGSAVEYHGGNLHRFMSHDEPHHGSGIHTPLEEIEEYEPLIPEGEEGSPRPRAKVVKKRPGMEHHHFPSQDIWEDTPSSLQFSTTVQTPDPEEEKTVAVPVASLATPAAELHREARVVDDETGEEKLLVKPHYASRGMDALQRFPSKDIWEDTPSSLQFHTTVGGPQMDDSRSPPDDRPTTSAISGTPDNGDGRATTSIAPAMRPSLPARPKQRSKLAEELKPSEVPAPSGEESREVSEEQPSSPEKTKAPPIPDRPKPTVPARPARPTKTDQADAGVELTKTASLDSQSSAETGTSPPLPAKTKPVVPARPGGEKIAALKAGFMNDLNNRLKIGPQAPPSKSRELEAEQVEEVEKAPLADARKSRAKGPTRRKPASAAAEEQSFGFSMSTTMTMWTIDEGEEIQVPLNTADPAGAVKPAFEEALSANTAANTAEPALAESALAEKELPVPTSEELASNSLQPDEQKSLQAKLEASLAAVGAGPAPAETSESSAAAEKADVHTAVLPDETETTSADKAVQEASVVAKDAETSAT